MQDDHGGNEFRCSMVSQVVWGMLWRERERQREKCSGSEGDSNDNTLMIVRDNVAISRPAVMTALVKLFEAPQDVRGAAADAAQDDELFAIDIEETGYQAQFSQLTTTSGAKLDPTAGIVEPKQLLVEGLVRFNQAYPGRVSVYFVGVCTCVF